MRILVIGGSGTIGKRVVAGLNDKHEVLTAGRNSGDVRVQIEDSRSIRSLYESIGKLNGVVSIAGEAKWASLAELTEEDYLYGLKNKLMGQVNLVRLGQEYLNSNGSFTLTSGILAEDPVVGTSSAAMINGALHGFVKAAALEMREGKRINVVAPGLVEDSYLKFKEFFPGRNAVPMDRVVNAYIRSIEGRANGEIIRVYI
jgi:NAD(P)-dependent dehydrogenase (short-subunit alcohol dehydrogenase family)